MRRMTTSPAPGASPGASPSASPGAAARAPASARPRLSRRLTLATAFLAATRATPQTMPPQAAIATSFDANTVPELARGLARQPHRPRQSALPREFQRLDYDAYRKINFDRRQAWWASEGLPFQLQPHHRGFLFENRVDLFEVEAGQARPLVYSPAMFEFGGLPVPAAGADIGFAGLRILCPLNSADRFDELCSFLGASYFRGLGRGQAYGASARGLAINTAEPAGEEFPAFTAFWLEKPAPAAPAMRLHALLESASVTGAYSFAITPGEATVMEIRAQLFPRVDVPRLGLAPASSMFFFGPQDRDGTSDYRPAVHDSDGLLLRNGAGQQLWRPLSNPRELQVSGFQDATPRGFGLLQRARDFADFQDLEAQYHRRPGLWMEPLEDWGQGEVQLLEIPTRSEIHDNIAAAWRPRQGLQAGSPRAFGYRLHWLSAEPAGAGPLLGFMATRIAAANGASGEQRRRRRFVLDTTAATRPTMPEPRITLSGGTVHNAVVQPNPQTGGLRLSFELDPGGESLIEMTARLVSQEQPISETWVYRWTA